ncbi:MAG TPA: hypothetical protein VJB14_01640 [Planctomycetota bacterium]|nr:hypothetical protein [Planctomycetota bacterium]
MTGDFPAAHSMDTRWFALDRCGHVAVLFSGEEGAVVKGAPSVGEPFDAQELRAGELEWCLKRGILRPGGHDTAVTMHEERRTKDGSVSWSGRVEGGGVVVHSACGFFLCGPEATRERILAWYETGRQSLSPGWYDLRFGETDGRPWVRGVLTSLAWNRMHGGPGFCLGCVQSGPVGLEERCRLHGLFTFHCSDYGNPPYRREESPSAPVLFDELSRRFEGGLPAGLPRFEAFCFREKEVLQPIQWLPSNSYDWDDWVREDGTTVHREGDDFPAAHSMDTDWYAVDRDGHVASFRSGQGGAVPKDVPRGSDYFTGLYAVQEAGLESAPIFDLEGYRAAEFHSHWVGTDPLIVFPRDVSALEGEVRAGRALPYRAKSGIAFLWRGMTQGDLDALHRNDGCLGCFYSHVWELVGDRTKWNDLARHGLFVYETHWDTMCGPYGREREPEPPVPIDRLPLVVREAAVLHRLERVCFRDLPWIQVLDHWACETLTAARLDGRRIRGVAGKEEEYRAEYEQHCRNAAEWGFEIDPPVSGP